MRGPQISRPIEEVLAEARALIEGGAKELNLIAQDTTSYGLDWDRKLHLHDLLATLAGSIRDNVWFRLLYAYPRSLTGETLDILAGDPRFCPYIDIPLQHINDAMLEAMGRSANRAQTEAQLDLIETRLPGAALRTTFIVGYPGETESQFQELLAFVKKGRFTHAGVFLYSTEVKTPAASLADNVPLAEKQRRRQELMLAQLDVSRSRLQERVGQTEDVLIDGTLTPGTEAPAGAHAIGRSQREAPEVDGVVFLCGRRPKGVLTGRRMKVRISESLDYDLLAEPLREKRRGRSR